MPGQMFNTGDDKKLKQLEKDIKHMKKDMRKTFAEPKKPKNVMLPVYIGIGILLLCVLALVGVMLYPKFFMM